MWPHKIESILSVGIFLKEFGDYNWALTPDEAINAIRKLKDIKMPILGGDVYERKDDAFRHTYDSWCCTKEENESYASFFYRSIKCAEEYVLNYPIQKNEEGIYFTLVPSDDKELIASNSPGL